MGQAVTPHTNMALAGPPKTSRILSAAFRLFFLLAGLYAIVSAAAWALWLALHAAGVIVLEASIAGEPYLWHGHEMIFGYAGAVLGGFLLTAVPNWTGQPPLRGWPLGLLGAFWLAGRLAMWTSAYLPLWLVALIDLAFLPALAAAVWFALRHRPRPRNLVVLGIVAGLIAGNIMVHLHWLGLAEGMGSRGLATALLSLALLIAIIGGRIVPSFTANAFRAAGRTDGLPRSLRPLDAAAVLSLLLLLLARAAEMPDSVLAGIAGFSAAAHALRLSLWRSLGTWSSPILWALHLAYLWLVLGLATLALAYAHVLAESAAMHAIAIGAVGGMTLAVMTRAALGHSGRPLAVAPAIAVAYVLVSLSAILRVYLTWLVPGQYMVWVIAGAIAWILAFLLYLAVYWPVLTGPEATPRANA